MTKPARRSHFIAQFYLRNFAEPMFSDNLCVYDINKQRWNRRTPNGVGWFPHLYSMFDVDGIRKDDFEKFLSEHVETPAAPALKKLATGGAVDQNERSAVALFIALTASRSPKMMNDVVTTHLAGLASPDRAELDGFVKLWCDWTGRSYDSKSHSEFLKPSNFGAIWIWSESLQHRLLEWEWHLIQTRKEQTFVTSDHPVFMRREEDVHLVSFPVSSEFALIITKGGEFNESRDHSKEVLIVNRQTIAGASEFVVACTEEFPGAKFSRYKQNI